MIIQFFLFINLKIDHYLRIIFELIITKLQSSFANFFWFCWPFIVYLYLSGVWYYPPFLSTIPEYSWTLLTFYLHVLTSPRNSWISISFPDFPRYPATFADSWHCPGTPCRRPLHQRLFEYTSVRHWTWQSYRVQLQVWVEESFPRCGSRCTARRLRYLQHGTGTNIRVQGYESSVDEVLNPTMWLL